ncbi:MAG: pilin [Candidatus Spechtbacterales bacterium]
MKYISLFIVPGFLMLLLAVALFGFGIAPSARAVPCEIDPLDPTAGPIDCPDATHRCVVQNGENTCKALCPPGNTTSTVCGAGEFCNAQNKCEAAVPGPNDRNYSEEGLVPDCGNRGNPCTFVHFFQLLHNILDFAIFTLAPILVVLMTAAGGFMMIVSMGNPSRFNRGRQYLVNAFIGYGIVLIAWLLVNTFLTALDVAEWVGFGSWWRITISGS